MRSATSPAKVSSGNPFMTPLTIGGIAALVLVLIIGKLVSKHLPRDADQVSEQWLRENRYTRKGDDRW